jgi:hypothetical protein
MMLRVLLVLMILNAAPVAAGDHVGQRRGAGWRTEERRLLKEILGRPVYQRWKLRREPEERPREKSYLGEMARAILDDMWRGIKDFFSWLRKLFDKSGVSAPDMPLAGGDLADILRKGAWAAFAALLALAGLYLYGLRGKAGGRIRMAAVLSRRKVREALDGADALAMDWRGWMDVADGMEEEGDFRAMYRAMYLSLLSGLHEKGRIDFRANRTNWAYVNGYKGSREERETFGELTGLFDQVWYGLKSPGLVSIGEVKARANRLLAPDKAA